MDELEEEGEDEDLEEGYSEDKEVLKEVLNLRFSNLSKKKVHEVNKNEAGMSSSSTRKDVYHSKVDSDTDDEDQVELVFVRRTNTGAWGRAAGGVISSGGGHKATSRSSFGSRSSVGSNIGGIASASRSSLSHRGSISETVAAITAHRSSLSSGSLLSSRTSSSRPVSCRASNVAVGSSSVRPNSTVSSGTYRPQNRRGSGLSLTSLGISSNVASSGLYTGGYSLDSAEEFRSAINESCEKESSTVISGGDRRKESLSKASSFGVGNEKTSRVGGLSGSEEEKYEEESCDGVVTRLLDQGVPVLQDEKTGVRGIGANIIKCASWVSTKVRDNVLCSK